MTVQIQNPGKSGHFVEFVRSALFDSGSMVVGFSSDDWKVGRVILQRLDSSTVVYIVVVSRLQDVYSAGESG